MSTTPGAGTGAGAHHLPSPPLPQEELGLARALARRCRGRTVVLGRASAALRDRLASAGIDAHVRAIGDPPNEPAAGAPFDTVLVVDALEHVEPEARSSALARAYAAVGQRGQLLVCVPHGGNARGPGARSFERAELKSLLEQIDQPRMYKDQPFGWLFFGIEREAAIDHAVADRCRVIASLCRGRVLELGCGAGHLSAEIARRGLRVLGVDLSARKIERARARYPGIEFLEQDILEMPADAVHDTVVLAEVLEHVPAAVGDRMLALAWAMVAPGGRLVVSVPNEDLVPHRNHVREFTVASLRDCLAAFGAATVETRQPFKWLLMYVDKAAAAG
ncbi:MAG TPA: class I SAM-dependent methyltransferase [Planctomycetota bacterium]|nr:class I SAM-dependent methyltransferase [Planctomycetota bacterium]